MPRRITLTACQTTFVVEVDDRVVVLDENPVDDEVDVLDCPSPDLPAGAPDRTAWDLLMLYDCWVRGSDDFLSDAGIHVVSITCDGKSCYRNPATIQPARQTQNK